MLWPRWACTIVMPQRAGVYPQLSATGPAIQHVYTQKRCACKIDANLISSYLQIHKLDFARLFLKSGSAASHRGPAVRVFRKGQVQAGGPAGPVLPRYAVGCFHLLPLCTRFGFLQVRMSRGQYQNERFQDLLMMEQTLLPVTYRQGTIIRLFCD